MGSLPTDDPLAVEAVTAIHTGDVATLRRLLSENPELVTVGLGGDVGQLGDGGMTRRLLHVATDWPGHFPNVTATIEALVNAGADVDARFTGPHNETPLHWAASSDDVAALDALLDAGADIEARGAVIGGGTPISDATAFGQWVTARRLLERGASTTLGAGRDARRDRPRPRLPRRPDPAHCRRDHRGLLVRLPRRPTSGSRNSAPPGSRHGSAGTS